MSTIELYHRGKLADRRHAGNIGCEYGEYCVPNTPMSICSGIILAEEANNPGGGRSAGIETSQLGERKSPRKTKTGGIFVFLKPRNSRNRS